MSRWPDSPRSLVASTLLGIALGVGCGADDRVPGTGGDPAPVAFEVVAPPPHGPFPNVRGSIWTRGDTVVVDRYVSFDRRATWRAVELVPEGRLPVDFVFLSETTGVARTGLNAFTWVDLEAGTFRGLSGEREDLSGWAVHEGHLYHLVEEVTPGASVADERAVAHFFRLDLDDPAAEWERLASLSTTYAPLRFQPSLHATDAGLVAVTRFGFHTSVDGGRSWRAAPAAPSGLGGALGDLNPARVTRAGNVLVLQGQNTVASYDGGATYETIGRSPGPSVDWMELELLPGGTLAFPESRLRSDDDGRTWRSFLEADFPRHRAYLRGDEVYLSDATGGPTLVVRADGEVEMLLARTASEPGGGLLRAVPLEGGDVVGLVAGQQIRFRPGQHAWTWEREWGSGVGLFDAGGGRLALATSASGGRTPTLVFSDDGGATWGEPVSLPSEAAVERLVVLPDRLIAYARAREACSGTLLESLDEGLTWSALPTVSALLDSEGLVVVSGFLDHVPIATTRDGVIFGASSESFPIGPSCNTGDTYPSRSDDAGRSWVRIGGGTTAEVEHLPIATTSRDDLVTAALWRTGSSATGDGLDVWLFRRDAERWARVGLPAVDGEPVRADGLLGVDARVAAGDRLHLTVFGQGLVRSVQPLR